MLAGIDHVATITNDTERLVRFYVEHFEATVAGTLTEPGDGPRVTVIQLGPGSELNVFQIEGNDQADHQKPMFGRGRLDHLGLLAADLDAFEAIRDRLLASGACDTFVTDFGPKLSLFFTDPDGLEGEVLVANPDARPGVLNPPGTPAVRYQP
jgi:catechol 2,3-dioxygenase-like lactoylglutathione lyase family enzyme